MTWYLAIGGKQGFHDTRSAWSATEASAATEVGAPMAAGRADTAFDGADGTDEPVLFVAWTVNVYVMPVCERPVTTHHESLAFAVVAVKYPGLDVTV